MPKQKRDYVALKKEFMESEYTDLRSFIATKSVPYNRHTREYMKWWAKEKKALKVKATENAIAKVWNKLSKQLEPSTEFLLWNITKAIELTKVKLDQMEQKWNINVKDLNTIWWMNRIQNWQPTTYVKEEQDVNQTVRMEWIHIIMWGNIDQNQWDEKV